MRKLNEIAGDLQTLLSDYFQTVRISALQTSDQLLKEIRAINPGKLPGVIIVFDNLNFEGMTMTNTAHLTLVLVDQFRAGSDERAMSVFKAASDLAALFPPDGKEVNGTYFYPVDCVASGLDSDHAVIAVGIEVKQG